MSCGVTDASRMDPVLLKLWCRLAATAPISPLAWKPPYATSAALKSKSKKQNKTKQNTALCKIDDYQQGSTP